MYNPLAQYRTSLFSISRSEVSLKPIPTPVGPAACRMWLLRTTTPSLYIRKMPTVFW